MFGLLQVNGAHYPDQPSVHEGLESGYGAEAFPSD